MLTKWQPERSRWCLCIGLVQLWAASSPATAPTRRWRSGTHQQECLKTIEGHRWLFLAKCCVF